MHHGPHPLRFGFAADCGDLFIGHGLVAPADASVEGRLIACRVGRGQHQQWLYLFTTTSLPVEEVVALYGCRWRIETDPRSLKQTVRLYRICAHSADMMEKELLVAVMAYNLVRAIMFQAAQRAQIDPRQLSFTYACNHRAR